MKIKAGDNVIVVAGKDKGRKGKVLKVLPKQNRVVVEGVNVVKKHMKARSNDQKGGIIDKTLPLHASNVMMIDSSTGKPTRIGMKVEGSKKVRIAKKSGKTL